MEINLLDDVAPASNELGAIAEAAQRVLILQDEINALREQLKDKEQTLRQLTETEMPDLMQELNVKDFTLTDGSKVSLSDIVSVSIPSAGAIDRAVGDKKEELYQRQQECFDWLRKHGGADLIKSNVEIPFGKGEDDRAKDLKENLRKDKIFYRESVGVHHQTAKAFIGECLTRGINVPAEMFKLFTGQKVQIRRP